jgi:predicted nucleic acid-binding protein
MARVAGHLLAAVGAGSETAIDALVIATAIRFGGGIVATHDPDDLRRLAAARPHVAILKI